MLGLDKPTKSCCDLSKFTSLKIICTSLHKYPCSQNREILIYTTQFFLNRTTLRCDVKPHPWKRFTLFHKIAQSTKMNNFENRT